MSLKKNKNDKLSKENHSEEQLIKRKSDRKKRAKKENLTDKIKTLQEKIELVKDEKLRALAELENNRRRMQKEREENAKYGAAHIAKDFFSVLDNFDRAIISSPKKLLKQDEIEKKYISLHEGVEIIQKDILSIFKRHGIELISPSKGEKFDPNIHQAMLEIPTDEFEPGFVCEILQSGYSIYERLLRPAMVGVSKKNSK